VELGTELRRNPERIDDHCFLILVWLLFGNREQPKSRNCVRMGEAAHSGKCSRKASTFQVRVSSTMNVFVRKRVYAAGVTLLGVSLGVGGAAQAQTAAPQARVVEAVRNDKLIMLRGNVHPQARAAND